MATYHGNEGAVHVGANAVLELKSFTHTNTAESADDSAAGDAYRTRKAGKKDGSGTMEVHYDPTDATGQELLVEGATVNVVMYPSGTTTGHGKLEGDVFIDSVGVAMEQDGIVSRTVNYSNYLPHSLET